MQHCDFVNRFWSVRVDKWPAVFSIISSYVDLGFFKKRWISNVQLTIIQSLHFTEEHIAINLPFVLE